MSNRVDAPRHRADGRPATPLTSLASSVEGIGRKTVVAVASSGMVMAVGAVPAAAAPNPADTTALTSSAGTVIGSVSLASVPDEAEWALDVPAISVTKPEPKPEPKPEVQYQIKTENTVTASKASKASSEPKTTNSYVPPSVAGNLILEIAARYVGVPYVYGGSSPSGFDCSGFTQYVYGQAGISIPRTDSQQHNAGTVISRDQALPGDIIWNPGHVAIYAGDGMQIDAPHTGSYVQFRKITASNPIFIRF